MSARRLLGSNTSYGRRRPAHDLGETVVDLMWGSIGRTPLTPVLVSKAGRRHRVMLKLEGTNPTGSVKDRTAAALLMSLHARNPLTPGSVVVESTSGNLGLALARLVASIDCRLVAVVDPKAPPYTLAQLRGLDVEIELVEEPDDFGGYLVSRLQRVRSLLAANPHFRWCDQYSNPANPMAHRATTGPEILHELGGRVGAVYVSISTGGTLAGISEFLRPTASGTRIVAVDAAGSIALGGRPHLRYNTGVGASRRSLFLDRRHYDAVRRITDAEAFAVCRMVRDDTGLSLGGSSGCAVAACVIELNLLHGNHPAVCLCPDDGGRYGQTFYDDGWLADRHLSGEVEEVTRRWRADGVHFELEDPHGLSVVR